MESERLPLVSSFLYQRKQLWATGKFSTCRRNTAVLTSWLVTGSGPYRLKHHLFFHVPLTQLGVNSHDSAEDLRPPRRPQGWLDGSMALNFWWGGPFTTKRITWWILLPPFTTSFKGYVTFLCFLGVAVRTLNGLENAWTCCFPLECFFWAPILDKHECMWTLKSLGADSGGWRLGEDRRCVCVFFK